jgi:3-isopropylmalate dehydrogenase
MSKHRIAWLPGDGIGNDVCEAARMVFDGVGLDAQYLHGDIGWEFWKREGNPLPDRTVELLRNTDCAFFGAITSKPKGEATNELDPSLKDKGLSYFSPIVKMRQFLDLYVCLRPCKAYPGNPLNYKEGIDLVIFRENTEGMYIGVEFHPIPEGMFTFKGMEKIQRDAAISVRSISPRGSERIVKAAFEYARKNRRKKVTAVHKANVLRATDAIFLDAARRIAAEYPDIQYDEANVDAIMMWLLKNPFNYDIIVTTNLFGDIVSDLCAQLVGGLGFGCSGNIGDNYAVFEPTHGSAPKYAGQFKVNPIATILAGRMMLDWLGEKEKATAVGSAVAEVLLEGRVRTYDMGGNASTIEMAKAVAEKVRG